MQAYCLKVKMTWLHATTMWKVDGSSKLVFDSLGYPFSIDKFFDVDEDGMGLKYSIILSYDFFKADGAN